MDVLAAGQPVNTTATVIVGITPPAAASAPPSAPAPPPIEAAGPLPGTPQVTPAPQVQAAQPQASTTESSSAPKDRGGIAPAIAKLFGSAPVPTPIPLNVSYRVVRDPNEIVTVFTDPKTGQEVAQFPPDVLIGIAEFFDQQTGVTLDRDA